MEINNFSSRSYICLTTWWTEVSHQSKVGFKCHTIVNRISWLHFPNRTKSPKAEDAQYKNIHVRFFL